MHCNKYRETTGKPPTHEVVVQHDSRDASHPFLQGRVKLYKDQGKNVVLRSVDGRTLLEKADALRKNDPRAVAQPSS